MSDHRRPGHCDIADDSGGDAAGDVSKRMRRRWEQKRRSWQQQYQGTVILMVNGIIRSAFKRSSRWMESDCDNNQRINNKDQSRKNYTFKNQHKQSQSKVGPPWTRDGRWVKRWRLSNCSWEQCGDAWCARPLGSHNDIYTESRVVAPGRRPAHGRSQGRFHYAR